MSGMVHDQINVNVVAVAGGALDEREEAVHEVVDDLVNDSTAKKKDKVSDLWKAHHALVARVEHLELKFNAKEDDNLQANVQVEKNASAISKDMNEEDNRSAQALLDHQYSQYVPADDLAAAESLVLMAEHSQASTSHQVETSSVDLQAIVGRLESLELALEALKNKRVGQHKNKN